jgi:hypothetical protein
MRPGSPERCRPQANHVQPLRKRIHEDLPRQSRCLHPNGPAARLLSRKNEIVENELIFEYNQNCKIIQLC